jgi:hypothetical protein
MQFIFFLQTSNLHPNKQKYNFFIILNMKNIFLKIKIENTENRKHIIFKNENR